MVSDKINGLLSFVGRPASVWHDTDVADATNALSMNYVCPDDSEGRDWRAKRLAPTEFLQSNRETFSRKPPTI